MRSSIYYDRGAAHVTATRASESDSAGVPLLAGRDFGPGDGPNTPCAAIVNETLARRLWPDGDPVSRSLVLDGRRCAVVGIVSDAQYRSAVYPPYPPVPFVYLDFWQQEDLAREPAEARLHVRVAGGVVLGLAGSFAASRLFTHLLYDVGRYDPISWAAAPARLVLVAAAASYLPARRATRIDPAATLRGE